MALRNRSIIVCMAAATGLGACLDADATDARQDNRVDVGVTTAALSVCEETVPANRNIDGIPSYAQCPESMDSAIYSNNGVDTSLTQMGSDWVRTQGSGGYQCTELAHRYLQFRWGVKWIPNGNAGAWCDTQPPANTGVVQTMAPVHGDIMVLAPGSCGAAEGTGHVTVVDEVNDSKLVVIEQNGARRGNYNLSCGKCFLHVMANDGVAKPASGVGAAGASAPASPAPARGAAAGGATGRPRNPSTAGAAASATPAPTAAAGRAAPGIPSATAPVSAANPTATTTQNNLAAGSGAALPVAGAAAPASSPRVGTPEDGACTVAAVGSQHSHNLPVALGAALLGSLALRPRRRTPRA